MMRPSSVLGMLLAFLVIGCSSSVSTVEYDGGMPAPMRGAAPRSGYEGPSVLELAEDIEARKTALLSEGHALLASGSLMFEKGDGEAELSTLGKLHGADVVLYSYVPLGDLDKLTWRIEVRKEHVSPTEAMAYHKRYALNGGTLYEQIGHASLKSDRQTLLRFVLLRRLK